MIGSARFIDSDMVFLGEFREVFKHIEHVISCCLRGDNKLVAQLIPDLNGLTITVIALFHGGLYRPSNMSGRHPIKLSRLRDGLRKSIVLGDLGKLCLKRLNRLIACLYGCQQLFLWGTFDFRCWDCFLDMDDLGG